MHVQGMAIFPFIFVKYRGAKQDVVLINHEKIHLRQQLEMLILPFYICYIGNYLWNLILYKKHYEAYSNICFEREAYEYERDLDYLKKRKIWAFRHFF
jgi:hypothetical protein